jgi:hypothetical protein
MQEKADIITKWGREVRILRTALAFTQTRLAEAQGQEIPEPEEE